MAPKFEHEDKKLLYVIRSTFNCLGEGSWADCTDLYNCAATSHRTQDSLTSTYRSLDEAEMERTTSTAEWEVVRDKAREWLREKNKSAVSQSYTCYEQARGVEVANPAPRRAVPLPLEAWDWDAQVDPPANNSLFPQQQQQQDMWLEGTSHVADEFACSDVAPLLMEMGAHPPTLTTKYAFDKVVISEPSSVSMDGINCASISGFDSVGMPSFDSVDMPNSDSVGLPRLDYTALPMFNSALIPGFGSTAAMNNASTGIFCNTPLGVLDSPATSFISSSPVAAFNETTMSSFSCSAASESSTGPLLPWDMCDTDTEWVGFVNTVVRDSMHTPMYLEQFYMPYEESEAGFNLF